MSSPNIVVTVVLKLKSGDPVRSKNHLSVPDFDHADRPKIRAAMHRAPPIEAIQGTLNIHAAWHAWRCIFSECICKYTPIRYITIRPKNKSWMTAELHRISRHKCRLFKLAVRSGSLIDWEKYKEVRNLCTAKFQKAKSSYFAQRRQKLKSEIEGMSMVAPRQRHRENICRKSAHTSSRE